MSKKIYNTNAERHAAFRKRRSDERNAINHVRAQAQCLVPLDTPAPATWFRVVVQSPTGVHVEYVMEEKELDRLQADLRAFKRPTTPDVAPLGTYVYANQGPEMLKFSGLFILNFEGGAIISTARLDDFTPSDLYSIHSGLMDVLLSQKPRPRKTKTAA